MRVAGYIMAPLSVIFSSLIIAHRGQLGVSGENLKQLSVMEMMWPTFFFKDLISKLNGWHMAYNEESCQGLFSLQTRNVLEQEARTNPFIPWLENKSGKNNLIGFIYLSLDFIKNTSWGSGCCKRIQITIWGERGSSASSI